jgi:SOS-response transcriptional repressor LexA
MKDTPADRLKKLRIKKGFATAKDAAEAFGWTEVTYRSHENGTRGVTLSAARKYATAFGTSPGYILSEGGLGNSPIVNLLTNVTVAGAVSAGTFRYDEETEQEATQVPAVPRSDIPASAQYALKVDGPSVNKRIGDGAYAICARFDSYPGGAQHGQLVHVIRERAGLHEHTIKELRYTQDGAMLYPVSTDPRYQKPVALASGDDGEIVRIEGVVIGAFQPI